MSKQIVGYIRVSTTQQGKSGLGMAAQREALARFAAAEDLQIAAEYVEVENRQGLGCARSPPRARRRFGRCPPPQVPDHCCKAGSSVA